MCNDGAWAFTTLMLTKPGGQSLTSMRSSASCQTHLIRGEGTDDAVVAVGGPPGGGVGTTGAGSTARGQRLGSKGALGAHLAGQRVHAVCCPAGRANRAPGLLRRRNGPICTHRRLLRPDCQSSRCCSAGALQYLVVLG